MAAPLPADCSSFSRRCRRLRVRNCPGRLLPRITELSSSPSVRYANRLLSSALPHRGCRPFPHRNGQNEGIPTATRERYLFNIAKDWCYGRKHGLSIFGTPLVPFVSFGIADALDIWAVIGIEFLRPRRRLALCNENALVRCDPPLERYTGFDPEAGDILQTWTAFSNLQYRPGSSY